MIALYLFDPELKLFRTLLNCIKIAFASSPEMMIISYYKMLYSNLFDQNVFNKITCRNLTEPVIEFYKNQMVNVCILQHYLLFLHRCKEREINIVSFKDQPRMWRKCNNNRFTFYLSCPWNKTIEKSFMSTVNSVKNSKSCNRRYQIKIFVTIMNYHRIKLCLQN